MARASKAKTTTKPAAAAPHPVELRELPLDELHESPTNPRRTYDAVKLDELAECIRAEGVLEPIMVRPSSVSTTDAEWEIVFGSRRVRAARLAGLVSVPALIRADLSDAQALELQIAENNQRADVSPIDEADAILALVEQHGRDAHDVAARLGRSLPWVRARLALAGAESRIREALAQGIIGEGSAAMLARLPAEQQQDIGEDLQEQDTYRRPDGRWSTGDVRRLLTDRQRTHRLALATWDPRDATLAGGSLPSCNACPKRSNVQVALFGEAPLDDLCLDRECWQWKAEASDARKIAAAVDEGRTVITGDAARELLGQHNALAWDGEWISLDDTTPYGMEGLGDTDEVPWREVIGDKIAPTLIVIDGKVIEVVPRAALVEVVSKIDPGAAGDIEREGRMGRVGYDDEAEQAADTAAAERKAQQAAALDIELRAEMFAREQVVAEMDHSLHPSRLWPALATAIADLRGDPEVARVCERRHVAVGKGTTARAALDEYSVDLSPNEQLALVMELLAVRVVSPHAPSFVPTCTSAILGALDVDMAECRADAERDAKAAAKAAKKTTKKRSAA